MSTKKISEKLPAVAGGKPVRDEYLVYGQPLIEEESINEVVDSLRNSWIGTGPKVARFEEMFRDYKGASHAVAVNSCTAGLHLSMLGLGVGPGDEVITTPMTFCASVNAIIHTGATPVLADIDPVTMNIDPDEIERKITERTKAVLVVHFGGRPCDMDRIMALVEKHDLYLVEDCAHAVETMYKGRHAGTFGDVAAFSFYVTKNISTGEGGMILTEDEVRAGKIKMMALHGMSKDAWKRFSDDGYKHYNVVEPGFKYNMMDLQAALALCQMGKIEEYAARRRAIWDRYQQAFADLPLVLPAEEEPNTRHALHLYTVLLKTEDVHISRDELLTALHRENIGTGVHYLSVHVHQFYRDYFGCTMECYPNAKFVSDRTLSLPLSPKLTDRDVDDVISAVRRILTYYAR